MIQNRRGRVLVGKVESFLKELLAPAGKLKLQRMIRDGFPSHLIEPFLYLLTRKLGPEERVLLSRIAALRMNFENASQAVHVVNRTRREGEAGETVMVTRNLEFMEQIASVPEYWGAFLHLCANASHAKTILELGSCLGLSGCYLASGRSCEQFITIEGSKDLASMAHSNLGKIVDHFRIISALFDDGLDQLLPSLTTPLDLVHIDGDHDGERTLHYFRRIIPHLHAGSLMLFDDIHYSPDMLVAWTKLARWKGAAYSINVGRYGILLWHGENEEPQTYDFSLYASEWGKGDFGRM